MTTAFLKQAAPGVQGLRPYQPGKPVSELKRELGLDRVVKLASNENPNGAGPRAMEALSRLENPGRYPEGSGFELKAILSRQHDIAPERIVLGNGSNDVLDLVARVFLTPGRNAVFSRHAFAVYPIVTAAAGARAVVTPPRPADSTMPYGHDPEALAEAVDDDTGVVFVANPNNPTGTWLTPDEIEDLLKRVPEHVVVILDEAYREYMDATLCPDSRALLERYPNLVVTRTFSKVYGLAGLRAGYALCHADMADLLNRVRQPFNISTAAQVVAAAAAEDRTYLQGSVELNTEQRALLQDRLEGMGLFTLPSQANFVTFDVGRPSTPVFEALLREGIILRPLAGYELPNALRITTGNGEENREALTVLERVLESP